MVGETEQQWSGLGPCPFCAARAAVMITQQIDGMPEADDVIFVRCLHCYAQGPARAREEAAADAWNERHLVFCADDE